MIKPLMLGILLVALAAPALASLGGDAVSVENDRAVMQSGIRATHFAAYDVHELQAASGTLVREYISPAGKVFAVAWQGPAMPDMKQVLGSYFDQFQQAARAGVGRHAPIVVRDAGLVVETGGHMRSFNGRAYVPQLMPQGVQVKDVR